MMAGMSNWRADNRKREELPKSVSDEMIWRTRTCKRVRQSAVGTRSDRYSLQPHICFIDWQTGSSSVRVISIWRGIPIRV
jgi:hypothetical protein